ncbi:hypothetical protein [Sphaerisporangium corydalis]|uniref:Uncharacterized protein n=1 Tax=Sphaerisporangium corydalis TaxID=1441875 RepID=A0ABV9EGE4_9ACTN|nr:hypothetical protein [Sphaerisporangium corydalis]
MRKGTTAISAGALALALSGGTVLMAASPVLAASQRVTDCDRGGNPVSSLAGEVCDLAGQVADTVPELAGDGSSPVTDSTEATEPPEEAPSPLADTVEEQTPQVTGEPTPAPSPSASATPSPEPSEAAGASVLGVPVDTACLPVVTPPDCAQDARPSPSPQAPAPRDRSRTATEPASPPARETAPSRPSGEARPTPRTGTAAGGSGRDAGGRAAPSSPPVRRPSADVEAPPLIPLWPGQPLPVLAGRLDAHKVVPTRPYDVVGTALTAVLLASAILVTRIVQARRDDSGPQSMPFDGLRRPDTGRHRLA